MVTVLAIVLLGILWGGILFWFAGLFYFGIRFAEYLRRHHSDVYRRLMGDDVRPAFLPIPSPSLGGCHIPSEVLRFMWYSHDDLGDAKVAYLRKQYHRSIRNLVIWTGLAILFGFPLVAIHHIYR